MKRRASGILAPIFSLPNEFGIGDFGSCSYKFIDYLVSAGQTVWQILPLVETGYGNSPYSSVSSYSFSPYYISPEILQKEGLITRRELNAQKYNKNIIDYGFLYSKRYDMLKKAFSRFDKKGPDFVKCVKSKKYLDYALFMSLKNHFGFKPFYEWDTPYKTRDKIALSKYYKDNKEEVLFYEFVQFLAENEWKSVKEYANFNGVRIMGDLPLYVALDSVDVWTNPSLFKLDENFLPKKVAGVPPDYFSKDGQLWGNPVYDYTMHEKTGFAWWTSRIKSALKNYDLVRIDHFRGLDRYYEISSDATTARVGEWVEVPSKKLFSAIHEKVSKGKIIAEDLGVIDDGVRALLKEVGYPGMKILSFAFNGDNLNPYLPENISENSVCFTGTHDNDTLIGLIDSFSPEEKERFIKGVKQSLKNMGISRRVNSDKSLVSSVIELGFSVKSKLFILPLSDAFRLDKDYRINIPGAVREENWSIRYDKKFFTKSKAEQLLALTKKYKR